MTLLAFVFIILSKLYLITYSDTDCAFYAHCDSCTSAGQSCRWCPDDNRCHTHGSLYNPCHSWENYVETDKCPTDELQTNRYTNFNIDTAYRMLLYSYIAYSTPPSISNYYYKLSSSFVFQSSYVPIGDDLLDVFAYLGYDTTYKHIVISFRGTVGFTQLVEEMIWSSSTHWTSYPSVQITEYFGAATGAIVTTTTLYDDLISLKKLYPDYKVWITGHSLGGAMAAITAVDLLINVPEITGIIDSNDIVLYTFGQPRAGNYGFTQLIESLISVNNRFRVVNNADMVPHVPPCSSEQVDETNTYNCVETSDYYHFRTEIWFDEGEYEDNIMCGYRECIGTPYGEDVSCSNGLYPWYDYSISQHYMGNGDKPYGLPLTYGFCRMDGNSALEVAESDEPELKHDNSVSVMNIMLIIGCITVVISAIVILYFCTKRKKLNAFENAGYRKMSDVALTEIK